MWLPQGGKIIPTTYKINSTSCSEVNMYDYCSINNIFCRKNQFFYLQTKVIPSKFLAKNDICTYIYIHTFLYIYIYLFIKKE